MKKCNVFCGAAVLAATAMCLLPTRAHADLPDTIARVKPSVVMVGTYKATNSPRFQMRGTGFVVADGRQVVTNMHVLPDGNESTADTQLVVQVRSAAGEWQMRSATLLERDAPRDLALLRMEGEAAAALVLRDSNSVREGQAVAFMGFPIGGALGFSSVTHRATVSSITAAALPTPTAGQLNEKAIRSLRGGPFNIFQLDGTAYPGNSGGPLFDPDTGEVLGVVNMVFLKGTRESALSNPSGISYAIPSKHVIELLQRIK
jgi:S1-C subfamily serine protease